MRIEIKVKDRIGISQEVLTIFAENRWNICSLEVVTHYIYVHFISDNIILSEIQNSLLNRDDIIHCISVDLLPTQRREAHLQTLLDTIPDPIIDIDQNGIIVIINTAARSLLEGSNLRIEGQHIDKYIDQSFESMLSLPSSNFSLLFLEHSYLADITPIYSEHNASGVILTLRSMNRIGQHIALLQRLTDRIVNTSAQTSIGFKSAFVVPLKTPSRKCLATTSSFAICRNSQLL